MLRLLALILALTTGSIASAATLRVTQGETVVFNLTAQTGAGAALDITGATFTTYINGPKGAVNSFANSKHAIVSAAAGTYTLTLSAADTQALLVGSDREIVTKITQGSVITVVRGANILTVLPLYPLR